MATPPTPRHSQRRAGYDEEGNDLLPVHTLKVRHTAVWRNSQNPDCKLNAFGIRLKARRVGSV